MEILEGVCGKIWAYFSISFYLGQVLNRKGDYSIVDIMRALIKADFSSDVWFTN